PIDHDNVAPIYHRIICLPAANIRQVKCRRHTLTIDLPEHGHTPLIGSIVGAPGHRNRLDQGDLAWHREYTGTADRSLDRYTATGRTDYANSDVGIPE